MSIETTEDGSGVALRLETSIAVGFAQHPEVRGRSVAFWLGDRCAFLTVEGARLLARQIEENADHVESLDGRDRGAEADTDIAAITVETLWRAFVKFNPQTREWTTAVPETPVQGAVDTEIRVRRTPGTGAEAEPSEAPPVSLGT